MQAGPSWGGHPLITHRRASHRGLPRPREPVLLTEVSLTLFVALPAPSVFLIMPTYPKDTLNTLPSPPLERGERNPVSQGRRCYPKGLEPLSLSPASCSGTPAGLSQAEKGPGTHQGAQLPFWASSLAAHFWTLQALLLPPSGRCRNCIFPWLHL